MPARPASTGAAIHRLTTTASGGKSTTATCVTTNGTSVDQIIGRRSVATSATGRATVVLLVLLAAKIVAAATQLTNGRETTRPMTATSGSTHAELSPSASTSVPRDVHRNRIHWTTAASATPTSARAPTRS